MRRVCGCARRIGLDPQLLNVLGVVAVGSHMKALQLGHGVDSRGKLGLGHRDEGEPGHEGLGKKART